eukprot:gnl/Dysnectes_brevis/7147_a11707_461.p1 GENE.gnl/Dysnectes_brevis/7147_a11707_461~~gnl/Dysnectes_brevis/7147_a11707_461.p1  ORF type:complete len:261 (+),score=22.16 gnl/Dysnectes_brevis/7147_a11707_461:146-928(+)
MAKYFCNYCKKFIDDNLTSRRHHEQGNTHKQAVREFILAQERAARSEMKIARLTKDVLESASFHEEQSVPMPSCESQQHSKRTIRPYTDPNSGVVSSDVSIPVFRPPLTHTIHDSATHQQLSALLETRDAQKGQVDPIHDEVMATEGLDPAPLPPGLEYLQEERPPREPQHTPDPNTKEPSRPTPINRPAGVIGTWEVVVEGESNKDSTEESHMPHKSKMIHGQHSNSVRIRAERQLRGATRIIDKKKGKRRRRSKISFE